MLGLARAIQVANPRGSVIHKGLRPAALAKQPEKKVKQAKGLLRVLLVVALGYLPAANAALLFESYTPSSVQLGGHGGYTYGAEFTVSSPSLLTMLGAFASTSSDMRVAIWQVSNPQALLTAIVPQVSTREGWNWTFVDVADLTLLPTATYRIGAETQDSTVAWGGTRTVGSGITVADGHVRSGSNGFLYPDQQFSGFFAAANAQIVPIPEPSSYALLLAGLAGLWFTHRRRQNEVGVTIR
jgi:hypothetical protein